MRTIGFQQAVERIVSEHSDYEADAYHFLREALEFTVKRQQKRRGDTARHVNAGQLLGGWRDYALREYGPMAATVIESWGIRETRDVGVLVFRLIDAGVFGRNEGDTLEAFEGGFDFHDAFVNPYLPQSRRVVAGKSQPVQHQ